MGNNLNSDKYRYKLPIHAYLPSKELAWIVGYILGDGCLDKYHKNGYYTISAKTKDDDLKDMFIKTFEAWSGFKPYADWTAGGKHKFPTGIYKTKGVWRVRICFKKAYIFLKQFKDNPLYCLEFFPKCYWKYILKGLWDAEGSIFSVNKNTVRITFYNTDEAILELYKRICKSLNFDYTVTSNEIKLNHMEDVIRFVDDIGVTIKRKLTDDVKNRIEYAKKIKNAYDKIMELKINGYSRNEVYKKIREIPYDTLTKWYYGYRIPKIFSSNYTLHAYGKK